MEQQTIFDTLDSFQVREVVPQASQSHRINGKQSITDTILKHISQTHFFQSLRNNYSCFKDFTQKDLKSILKTGQLFRVTKSKNNMVINFSQQTVCVVIFGQLLTQGRTFTKDDFFVIRQDKIEMFFRHKTTLVMLHKEDVQNKLYCLQNFYFKKQQIEKIIPVELLQLTKQQINNLTQNAQSFLGNSVGSVIHCSGNFFEGIFVLFEGNFALKMESGIILTQIGFDYYGEEILWSDKYSYELQALTTPYRLILLPKKLLLEVLTEDNILQIRQLHKRKLQFRNQMLQNIQSNLQYTKKFLKKIEVVNKIKNPQFKETNGKISKKPFTKQFIMKQKQIHQVHNNVNSSSIIDPASTSSTVKESNSLKKTNYTTYSNFRSTLYKDQRAKSQKLFRKRVQTQPGRKRSLLVTEKEKQLRGKRVKTQRNQGQITPRPISVLLKYYESMNPLVRSKKEQKNSESKIFLSTSRERRLVTNMKLHRETFFRQFLEQKTSDVRAFKAWK